MVVLCDFTEIIGDNAVTIGDNDPEWEGTFGTGGRKRDSSAFLLFNVRHLTHSKKDAAVKVNGQVVGHIHNYYPGGDGVDENDVGDPAKHRQQDHYYTQMISVAGSTLKDGNNEIEISAVDFPGNSGSNKFDDFNLKNMVCFFHQSS